MPLVCFKARSILPSYDRINIYGQKLISTYQGFPPNRIPTHVSGLGRSLSACILYFTYCRTSLALLLPLCIGDHGYSPSNHCCIKPQVFLPTVSNSWCCRSASLMVFCLYIYSCLVANRPRALINPRHSACYWPSFNRILVADERT